MNDLLIVSPRLDISLGLLQFRLDGAPVHNTCKVRFAKLA